MYQKPPSSKPIGDVQPILKDGRLARVELQRNGDQRIQKMEYIDRETNAASMVVTKEYLKGSLEAKISINPDRKSVGSMACESIPMPPYGRPEWAKEVSQ
jgi:hypothetical protein